MDKNSFDIKPIPYVRFDIKGNEVIVDPYISMENKKALMQAYIDIMINEDVAWADRYVMAEYMLMGSIIELNTSFNTTGVLTNTLENSELWLMVRNNIRNYNEFKSEIETVVRYAREDIQSKNTTDAAFTNLLLQVSKFLDKISQIDVSPEGVKSLMEALNYEKDEINKIVDPSKVKTKKRKETVLKTNETKVQ
jgi:hypothetical protein